VAEIRRIPQVMVHEVALGGVFSGVAPDGADSIETLFRGRLRKWLAGTVGGLFVIPTAFEPGWGLDRVLWAATGMGGVAINLIDDNGFIYPVAAVVGDAGTWVPPDSGGLPILPGWSVQVVGTNPLGAIGRVVVTMGRGWGQDAMGVSVPLLGEEQYPPAKTYTP